MSLRFEVLDRDGLARRGRLHTPHGTIETPCFIPVGTMGAVKGVTAVELESLGASIMLSNLYHLSLRPGIEVIEELGGLHAFTGWDRPILTDSGGFQVFSLSSLRTVDNDGVTFRSHLDGAAHRFTPENVVSAQQRIGVDIAMVLDECTPWPVSENEAAASLERTQSWAERSLEARGTGDTVLFGIVQDSVYQNLRAAAVERLADLDFDGFAVGGVSVGEPTELRRAVVEWTAPSLPDQKPRYLMGLGTPLDLAHAVQQGVDLFDCVLPSRNARHGVLFTRTGTMRIKNSRYRNDPQPIDEACPCPTCRSTSRALLHHLVRSGEITGAVLATLHNLRYYLDFMQELREATAAGRVSKSAAKLTDRYA